MDRRRFIKAFGVLAGAVVIAPQVLAEITFAEDLRPTDVLDTKTFRRAVKRLKAARDPNWTQARRVGIEVITGG